MIGLMSDSFIRNRPWAANSHVLQLHCIALRFCELQVPAKSCLGLRSRQLHVFKDPIEFRIERLRNEKRRQSRLNAGQIGFLFTS